MTYGDLESRSRSTIHILEHCLVLGTCCAKVEAPSSTIVWDIKHNVKLGQWPLVTLDIGQGQPKSNQVGSMDQGTFLPNYIKIRPVLFSEPHSQEIYKDINISLMVYRAVYLTRAGLFKFGNILQSLKQPTNWTAHQAFALCPGGPIRPIISSTKGLYR